MKSIKLLCIQQGRRAIAMIELIFAIVVIGIVMMSAPTLVSTSTQSTYTALQQESVTAAAAQISMIMMQEWDHNDANSTLEAPVLQTISGGAGGAILNCTAETPVGVTHSSGRFCKDTSNAYPSASNIAQDSAFRDIDDFHGTSSKVDIYNSEAYETYEGDYLDQNISIATTVNYGSDMPTSGSYDTNTTFSNPFSNISYTTTNIKLISVVLTSVNEADAINDKQIRLSAFMCNIGEPKQIRNNKPL